MSAEQIVDSGDALVAAMADAILNWRLWCHRRKDSYFPIDEDRGRVHHSVDCTPPPDASFALDPSQRHLEIWDVEGQAILPVAMVQKQTLIEFDARGPNGSPLPVLTMDQNVELSVFVLDFLLRNTRGLVRNRAKLIEALYVVAGDSDQSLAVAEGLIVSGKYDGNEVLDSEILNSTELIPEVLRNFAKGFLLCVVVPVDLLGQRTILKMSYQWAFRLEGNRWWNSVKGRRSLRLPMTAPSDTQSYHIELRLPGNVRCLGMSIPGPFVRKESASGGQAIRATEDLETRAHSNPAVHLHAQYLIPPYRSEAWVELEGARNVTFWASILGGILLSVLGLCLVWLVPGSTIVGAQSRPVALLLSIPALFLGFVSAKGDHTLGMPISLGHRIAMLGYALTLFVMSGVPLFTVEPDTAARVWMIGTWTLGSLCASTLLRLAAGKWRRILIKLGWPKPGRQSRSERDWRLRQ